MKQAITLFILFMMMPFAYAEMDPGHSPKEINWSEAVPEQITVQGSEDGLFRGLTIDNTNNGNSAHSALMLKAGSNEAHIGKNSPLHWRNPDLFWLMGSSDIRFVSQKSPGVPLMHIEGTGNVGIGTAYPREKLEVKGNVLIMDEEAGTLGSEILLNGNMESFTIGVADDWELLGSGTATLSQETIDVHEGSSSQKIEVHGEALNNFFSQYLAGLEKGHVYKLEFALKVITGSLDEVAIRERTSPPDWDIVFDENIGYTNGWVIKTYYFVMPENDAAILQFRSRFWSPVEYIIDAVSLREVTDFGGDLSVMGSLGVGTTMPEERLHVIGNILATGSICDSSGHCVSGGSGSDGLWTLIDGSDDIYRSVGNVGVGTPTPGFKLDVLGNLRLSGANNGLFRGITVENTDPGNLAFSTIMLSSGGSTAHIGKNTPTRTINPGAMWFQNSNSDPAFIFSNSNTGPGRLKLVNTHAGNSFSVFTLEATNSDSSISNAHIGKNSLSYSVNPGVMWFYNIDSDPAFLMSSDRDGVARMKLDNPNSGANGRSVLTLSANGALAHIGKNSPTSTINPNLMWFQTNDDFGFVSGANPDPNYRILHLEGFTGNVGIGTDSPQATLDVRGDVYFEGGSGDIDGDGDVDGADATILLNFINGINDPTPEEFSIGDIDGDGLLTYSDYYQVSYFPLGLGIHKTYAYGVSQGPNNKDNFLINYPLAVNVSSIPNPGHALDVGGAIWATDDICTGDIMGDFTCLSSDSALGLWDSVDGSDDIYRLDGNVGVGTATPYVLLDVETPALDGLDYALRLTNLNNQPNTAVGLLFSTATGNDPSSKGGIFFERKGNFGVGDLHFALDNDNTQNTKADLDDVKMTITQTGKVGIGTKKPQGGLNVVNAGKMQLLLNTTSDAGYAAMLFSNDVGNDLNIGIAGSGNPGRESSNSFIATDNDLIFYTQNQWEEVMRLKGNRRVGIRTSEPEAVLDVAGTVHIGDVGEGNRPLSIDGSGYGDIIVKNSLDEGYAGLILENDVGSVLNMGIAGSTYAYRDTDSAFIATDGEMRFYVNNQYEAALSLHDDRTVEIEEGLIFRTTGWVETSQVRYAGNAFTSESISGCGDSSDPDWFGSNTALTSEDGNVMYADFPYASGEDTNCMIAENFGFTVPAGAQITSIQVEIKRKRQNNGFYAFGANDKNIRLRFYDGLGQEYSGSGFNWGESWSTVLYGGPNSVQGIPPLWGHANGVLQPDDINNNNFGIAFRVDRADINGFLPNGPGEAQVEYVKITVKYRTLSGPDEFWDLKAETADTFKMVKRVPDSGITKDIFSVRNDEPSPIDTDYEFHIDTPGGLYLDNSAVAVKTSGSTWTNPSDERLKKNIKPIDNALEKLTKLEGKEYEWINPDEHSEGLQAGLIAQDVEKVFPSWVSEKTPNGKDKELIPEGDSEKLITIGNDFYAYTVEAFKELQEENRKLKQAICEINPDSEVCVE